MSEVSDATQIVVVMGKTACLLGNISIRAAVKVMDFLNTLYLSKWKGKVSFRRLRQIKGDDLLFLNMSTEEEGYLSAIENELDKHGIMFSRLPDLCGGDGRTQYVIAQSDAELFRAFLLDHTNGIYKKIKVGPVSPEDYLRTGYTGSGEVEREELKALRKSIPEEQKEAVEENVVTIRSNGREVSGDGDDYTKILRQFYHAYVREKELEEDSVARTIEQLPIEEHETWKMYEMPDGLHAIVIPAEDTITESTPSLFTVYTQQSYVIVDLRSEEKEVLKGADVVEIFRGKSIHETRKELGNLIRSRIPEIVPEAVRTVMK